MTDEEFDIYIQRMNFEVEVLSQLATPDQLKRLMMFGVQIGAVTWQLTNEEEDR